MPAATHGATRGRRFTPEYIAWCGARNRCNNRNDQAYSAYGGRGIRVCERWQSFENFLADMGPKPSAAHSLDRIDSNGNYEPGNCRWATRVEQNSNQRSNRVIEFRGEKRLLTDWARETGIERRTLAWRLDRGWSVERALMEHPEVTGKNCPTTAHLPHIPAEVLRRAYLDPQFGLPSVGELSRALRVSIAATKRRMDKANIAVRGRIEQQRISLVSVHERRLRAARIDGLKSLLAPHLAKIAVADPVGGAHDPVTFVRI